MTRSVDWLTFNYVRRIVFLYCLTLTMKELRSSKRC